MFAEEYDTNRTNLGTRISPTPGELTDTRLEKNARRKQPPEKSHQTNCLHPYTEVFGSNRANLVTDTGVANHRGLAVAVAEPWPWPWPSRGRG